MSTLLSIFLKDKNIINSHKRSVLNIVKSYAQSWPSTSKTLSLQYGNTKAWLYAKQALL